MNAGTKPKDSQPCQRQGDISIAAERLVNLIQANCGDARAIEAESPQADEAQPAGQV
jgi:hypothetical protein